MTMTQGFLNGRVHDGGVLDEEDLAPRPKRRSFTKEYRAATLAEYDRLPLHNGERGAMLRREGLYTSHLAEWRNQDARAVAAAAAAAVVAKPKRVAKSVAEKDLVRANARIEVLEAKLARTTLALEITGKAHALLGLLSESADTETMLTP